MPKLRTLRLRLAPAQQTRTRFLDTAGGAHKAHYQSEAHRSWRRAVLERDGFACIKCGAHGHGVRLVADPIVEIVDGGAPLDVTNGQTLCAICSSRKTAADRKARQGN